MHPIILDRKTFRDRVRACWLGKNIGGTLGAPLEGKRWAHALEFYEPVPTKALPNDDLDLQLVWLKMLEEQGPDPALPHFAEYWARYAARYPWNEYGFFMRNHARGLRPPVAGCFENYFVDEMGSPIRSEIWACIHPADPQAAARLAWKDSVVDHAGGEGMYGEMFWAAVESAAFVESDPLTLIRIGLNMIPLSSQIARVIREVVWCHANGLSWGAARERVATLFGHVQPCNAIPNHGFTIIGWLYGRDFGDRLCKAVNCGFDTDCTGATLGALLGILGGTAAIPRKWLAPVGEEIVTHKFTLNRGLPKTVAEMTDRTVALTARQVPRNDAVQFGNRTRLPSDLRTRLFRNEVARQALQQDVLAGVELCGKREVTFHYGGEPVWRPGIGREVRVSIDGRTEPVDLLVPKGWSAQRCGPAHFRLRAGRALRGRNAVRVAPADGAKVPFTILGPDEAKGFGAGYNVPACPKCGARIEECMCRKR